MAEGWAGGRRRAAHGGRRGLRTPRSAGGEGQPGTVRSRSHRRVFLELTGMKLSPDAPPLRRHERLVRRGRGRNPEEGGAG